MGRRSCVLGKIPIPDSAVIPSRLMVMYRNEINGKIAGAWAEKQKDTRDRGLQLRVHGCASQRRPPLLPQPVAAVVDHNRVSLAGVI